MSNTSTETVLLSYRGQELPCEIEFERLNDEATHWEVAITQRTKHGHASRRCSGIRVYGTRIDCIVTAIRKFRLAVFDEPDYTPAQYETALRQAGFTRCDCISSYHLHTKLVDGSVAHFNEAAAEDDCTTLRARVQYLVDARDFENSVLVNQ